jgi:hypothetical protein
VAIAVAFKLMKKGRDGDWSREFEELKVAAPHTAEFLATVGKLISGAMPGFLAPIDVAPAPAALLPPDADTVK